LRLEPLEDRCVPATITPTTFADGGLGSGSLRDAVLQLNADSGSDDDIIQLQAGTYSLTIPNVGGRHETAGLTGDLNVTQPSHRWIIQGAGPSTIIDASQLQDRVFQIVQPGTRVLFQDLVIRGGLAQDDGSDGALPGTTDSLGGGILNNGGDVTLDNVLLTNNVARGNGWDGAGNGHTAQGGGIYSTGGSLSISGSMIAANQATGGSGGGGGFCYSCGAADGGTGGAGQGGGLYSNGGTLDISGSTIATNQATGGSGGGGGASLTQAGGSQGNGGSGGPGGSGQGAGLYASNAMLTLTNATITMNTARGGDGGHGGDGRGYGYAGAGGTGGTGQGAGLFTSGVVTLANSTISTNFVHGGDGGVGGYLGGGFFLGTGGPGGAGGDGQGAGLEASVAMITFTNSTISSNTARGGDGGNGGGGPHGAGYPGNGGPALGGGNHVGSGTVDLINCTIAANTANASIGYQPGAGQGGGVSNSGGTIHARNTLIGDNTATTFPDFNGALASLGHNLVGNPQGGSGFDDTDLLNVDPLLGPLQDNGGPTFTMALFPGSPAIDAGDNTGATDWDQRGPGYPRIVNGIIDIGAFEVQAHAHGRPTGQPLPDPVPVQALGMVGGPLVGQSPDLLAAPSPLPGPGIPDGQTVQPEPVPVPTAAGQQAPGTFFDTYPGTGHPLASLGSLSARDLDLLALTMLGGP
jgi:hypothetical protein